MFINVRMTEHASKFLAAAVMAVVLLLIVLCVSIAAPAAYAQSDYRSSVPQSRAQVDLSFAPLVKQASPAVVNVYTRKKVQQSPFANDPVFNRLFGRQQQRQQGSLGSGVIVGNDGVIVTNNHVIEGADEYRIVLSDRREYSAELLLADERTDLAVLKIDDEAGRLPTLLFADTRDAEVGDLVLAIGNPFGVGQTVTSGIISATARTDVGVSDYAFFIQTDAAINPGNSGGALINNQGELVGVNTAIFSRSGGSNGIGFAIPAEMVKRVVDAAVDEGRITRPWLGLKGQSVSFDIAQSQGLERPIGIIITEIYDRGPADRAKLRRGDLVLAIDGREVYDERGLKFLAATQSPGERVTLDVLRSGKPQKVRVLLTPPPGATDGELRVLDGRHPLSGAEVAVLSPALAESMNSDPFLKGILVTRTGRRSLARRVGIRPGDVVVAINGKETITSRDLDRVLDGASSGTWTLTIERNGRRITTRPIKINI